MSAVTSRALLGLLGPALVALGCAGGAPEPTGSDDHHLTEGFAFDLMHTLPECNHPGHAPTWCSKDDGKILAQKSGMEDRVREILSRAQDPATSKIVIAYFSFSNRSVFDALCEKGKAGFSIEGFFDVSYRTLMPADLAKSCQGPAGGNVKVHFLGQVSQEPFIWRLHHNKFLLVEPGDGTPVSVNFSSGNLSSFGLSVHFDHWALLKAPATSNLVKQHDCVVDALRKAINPKGAPADEMIDDPSVYRETLNACLKDTLWTPGTEWVEKAVAQEAIAPLFSPDPNDNNARVLAQNISRVGAGGKIYGAMQHFLHFEIARELQRAVKRGVEVRLVMDDDVVTGEGEVPGVRDFYDSMLAPEVSGMNVQFLATNASEFQMMHNKFLVMEGVDGNKTRVFSGAGHFTTAGLRNNYENFYLSQSADLSAKYKELFEYMWPKSLTREAAEK